MVKLWDRNPKLHDIGALAESILKHGFRDAPIFDETAHCIIAGNGRLLALARLREQGADPPAGILVEDGRWKVPIQFGVNAQTKEAAEAFGLDHNNLGMSGGDFDLFDMQRMWDESLLGDLLTDLAEAEEGMAAWDWDDVDRLLEPDEAPEEEVEEEETAAKEVRYGVLIYCEDESHQLRVLMTLLDDEYVAKAVEVDA